MGFGKTLYENEISLDAQSIDQVSADLYQIFEKLYQKNAVKDGKRTALRLRFEVEEVLSKLSQADLQAAQKYKIYLKKHFFDYSIIIEQNGKFIDVFAKDDDDEFAAILDAYAFDSISRKAYSAGNTNLIRISVTIRKHNPLTDSFFAIFAAVVFSGILLYLPNNVATGVNEVLISPLLKTILSLFTMAALTMVFFNVLVGISNMQSVRFAKQTGLTVMRYAFSRNLIVIMISTILFVPIYGVLNGEFALSGNVLGELINVILDIIPKNLVEPFETKNALQIMVLGAFSGTVLLILGKQVDALKKVIVQLNLFSIKAVSVICKLTPIMIFLSISKLMLGRQFSEIINCWQLLSIQILMWLIYAIGTTAYISRKTEYPIRVLLKNTFPISLTGFSTSSSTACIYQNSNLLKNTYKISSYKVDVILPMFHLFYQPTVSVSLVAYSMYACAQNGITLSLFQLIIFVVVTVLVVLSGPQVAGGIIVILSVLYSTLGLPAEAINLAIGVDAIVGMVRCGFKQSFYSSEVMMVSRKI